MVADKIIFPFPAFAWAHTVTDRGIGEPFIMPTPFSRIMRSLHGDALRPAVVGMSVGMVLLAVWLTWFFTAEVTLCEVSRNAWMTDKETLVAKFPLGESRVRERRERIVMAEFPPQAKGRIRPGQTACLNLDRNHADLPAVVVKVREGSGKGPVQIQLVARMPPDLSPLRRAEKAQVRVEVEYVSPAGLLARTCKALRSEL